MEGYGGLHFIALALARAPLALVAVRAPAIVAGNHMIHIAALFAKGIAAGVAVFDDSALLAKGE
jgi:hypothetical protein